MDILDLNTCHKIKYENELLKKKFSKTRNENKELKWRLEILERKETEADLRKKIEAELNLGITTPSFATSNEISRFDKAQTNKTRLSHPKKDTARLSKNSRDFTYAQHYWSGAQQVSSTEVSPRSEALANGREPRPHKIISEESERLNKLLAMQNSVIKRYEIQLKEASAQAEKATEMSIVNERLKTEIAVLKCDAESRNHSKDEISGNKTSRSPAKQRGKAEDGPDMDSLKHELAQVKKERDKLRCEKKSLKSELSALDPEFFEEIEDLKFSLAEARRLNQEYEKTIKALSLQLGLSVPFFSKVDSRSLRERRQKLRSKSCERHKKNFPPSSSSSLSRSSSVRSLKPNLKNKARN